MSPENQHKPLCPVTRDDFNRLARVALNAFMTAQGMKNIALAAALGVHENTISNWRQGTEIPAYMVAQLGVFFGAPFWQAVYGSFGLAMRKRYEQRVAAERQALHEWSFITNTGTE